MRILIAIASLALPAGALAADPAAEFFARLYVNTCIKHIHAPEGLRTEMAGRNLAPLDTVAASDFLAGLPGRAWQVPSDAGDFVVSLNDEGICSVHARRADPAELEKLIDGLVAKPPPEAPLVARKERSVRSKGGRESTVIVYRWFVPDAPVVLQFILTMTAASEVAYQAVATAAKVRAEK